MFVPILAPLATLVFFATLWLLLILGAAVLEESGRRIAAAIKGEPACRQVAVHARMRVRQHLQLPMRAKPRWRAAA
jgi:hypothetical protein